MSRSMKIMEETFVKASSNSKVIGITIIIESEFKVVLDNIIRLDKNYNSYTVLIMTALVKGGNGIFNGESIEIFEESLVNPINNENVKGIRIMIDNKQQQKLFSKYPEAKSMSAIIGELVAKGITEIITDLKK